MTNWLLLVNAPGGRAGEIWKSLIGEAMKGFSNTRWWSKEEVEVQIAMNFGQLREFLRRLDSEGVGDATTKKMIAIYEADPLLLELSFAAMLDGAERLVSVTGEMEGERLEILLLYSRMEGLRSFGRALRDDEENRGLLPNVDALIKRTLKPKVGLLIKKEFPGHGTFEGKITKAEKLNSPGHSDHDKMIYTVTFSDGDTEDFNEGEIKPHLSIYGSELRSRTAASILGAYDYIERRLTGDCASPCDCRHSYEICELAQLFDPPFAAEHEAEINAAYVQRLAAIIPIANLRPGRRRRRCCRRWWPGQ